MPTLYRIIFTVASRLALPRTSNAHQMHRHHAHRPALQRLGRRGDLAPALCRSRWQIEATRSARRQYQR